jgi:hypothetical protein
VKKEELLGQLGQLAGLVEARPQVKEGDKLRRAAEE